MRHLYAAAKEPGVSFLIDKAKLFERRRCNHLPEDYPEPLSTRECLSSVVDPKGSATNKHRYVVASQELETRKALRSVMGVPLVCVLTGFLILHSMSLKRVSAYSYALTSLPKTEKIYPSALKTFESEQKLTSQSKQIYQ